MRLVPFHLANPSGRIAVRPAELPWRSIMARIKSDVRNRMEYVRNAPSNTRFHRISKMEVHIVPTGGTPALAADGSGAAIVLPDRGGTYKELPETLLKKRACINIQNTDYRCFQYCIMNWVSNWYKGRDSQRWPWKYMCYQDGTACGVSRRKKGVPLVPVDVGLDFTMVPTAAFLWTLNCLNRPTVRRWAFTFIPGAR
jgi:hypothetical protein